VELPLALPPGHLLAKMSPKTRTYRLDSLPQAEMSRPRVGASLLKARAYRGLCFLHCLELNQRMELQKNKQKGEKRKHGSKLSMKGLKHDGVSAGPCLCGLHTRFPGNSRQ